MARRCVSQALGFYPVLNEEQGVSYPAEGGVSIRLHLPEAKEKVLIKLMDGPSFPMEKDEEGYYCAKFDPGMGFSYVDVTVDGEIVLSPYLPIAFSDFRPINMIDVPGPGDEFYQPSEGECGTVVRHYYPSTLTGEMESCLVYQPPHFDPQKAYPILYLQHGLGENETGWVHQGRANFILDRLIKSGKAEPMLVVMCSGMVQMQGKYDYKVFPEQLVRDVIPYIEARYRTPGDKWHRAMAGLSMGSMHTSMATMTHPELFGYAGVFSGFLRHAWTKDQPHLAALNNAEKFAADYRVFFRAMGDKDIFFDRFEEDDALIEEKGVGASMIRRVYPGKHAWQVWRYCLRDFVPLLFKED